MSNNKSDELREMTVRDLFIGDNSIYEIPIYQRNFAWSKDEIKTLIQDVYDANKEERVNYYLGTLVTFHKDDNKFEVIDGQQRLTAVGLILSALKKTEEKDLLLSEKLTYKSRSDSLRALKAIDSVVEKAPNDGKNADEIRENLNYYKNELSKNGYNTFNGGPTDQGILNGFKDVIDSLLEVVEKDKGLEDFGTYFKENVCIIRYQVPKDTDLNQYFEIMNSRGEQLEQHEIVKANLMKTLSEQERKNFEGIWEACSKMNCYIQQSFRQHFGEAKLDVSVDKDKKEPISIFGSNLDSFNLKEKYGDKDFLNILNNDNDTPKDNNTNPTGDSEKPAKEGEPLTINNLCSEAGKEDKIEDKEDKEHFQPIIDFPNFLLIVLKITEALNGWEPKIRDEKITLDDKTLLRNFKRYFDSDGERVKTFAYNLLKAKFYLDNYIVHRSKEEREEEGKNPWQLKAWRKPENGSADEKNAPHNLCNDSETQDKLVQILSMFEVTYGSRQRKNYLFYCLYYLMNTNNPDVKSYFEFVEDLSRRFFFDFYLNKENSDTADTFDSAVLSGNELKFLKEKDETKQDSSGNQNNTDQSGQNESQLDKFKSLYGDGNATPSKNIPLFIFNYLDYKIWVLYYSRFRVEDTSKKEFNDDDFNTKFGCSLKENKDVLDRHVFKNFFFSRSRDSLEHYFPTANLITDSRDLNESRINCLGNYAMIGRSANSSGSNWTPEQKVGHYLDRSKKIDPVSVSSLKFRIMMKICKDSGTWNWDQIEDHQKKMLYILFDIEDSNGSQKSENDSSVKK